MLNVVADSQHEKQDDKEKRTLLDKILQIPQNFIGSFNVKVYKMRISLYLIASLAAGYSCNAAQANPVEDFVRAMVDLKRVSATCEPYVQGSPLTLTAGIDAYFTALKQPVPTPVNDEEKASIGKLLKQHAAYICSEKLVKAQNRYTAAAALYMQEKPAQWPDAPWIEFPQWCPDTACSGY